MGEYGAVDARAQLAAAFAAGVRYDGLDPDPSLRLLAGPDRATASAPIGDGPVAVADPADLGPARERLIGAGERVRSGAWYTPADVAAELVDAVVTTPGVVLDPSCGGGIFLLAAAERLHALDVPAGDAVASLRGIDVDPLAVAVTEAALWWWSARHGNPVVSGDALVVADALATPLPPAAAVVGNPPFLGQLRTVTSADHRRRDQLRDRFGDAVRPYTDEAWLFLLAGLEAAGESGRVCLLQPQSLLAARDAGPVRAVIDAHAAIESLWVDGRRRFEAAVDVCAPVLAVGATAHNDWSGALADAHGVPRVALHGTGDRNSESERSAGRRADASTCVLGDRARVAAGFRDEYYGLVDHVREGGDGPALVTVGAVDPMRQLNVAVRFAKRRWTRPVVDTAAVTGKARAWVDQQAGPKLVVATQTKVVEAMVDEDGRTVASVPAIVIQPCDARDLWRLAAALHAPCVTAWMLRQSAGTALSAGACKPTAALLASVPLPVDAAAWDEAAGMARALSRNPGYVTDLAAWKRFGAQADRAYGIDDADLLSWWLERLPVR